MHGQGAIPDIMGTQTNSAHGCTLDTRAVLCHAIQVGESYTIHRMASQLNGHSLLDMLSSPRCPDALMLSTCAAEALLLIVFFSPNADSESIAMGA